MIDKLKNIGIIILTIGIIWLVFFNKETSTIEVPVIIEVPIPGIQNTFDPIELPIPKTEKPRLILEKDFVKADSITKDSLYKDAVKERFYSEIFKDSTQSITVNTKVQGKLLKQQISYDIFSRTIQLDTIIEIPTPNKLKVFGLVELGSSTINIEPVVKSSVLFKTKTDKIISLSVDTQKNAYIGYGFKF